jgi:hypothetical protein
VVRHQTKGFGGLYIWGVYVCAFAATESPGMIDNFLSMFGRMFTGTNSTLEAQELSQKGLHFCIHLQGCYFAINLLFFLAKRGV